MCLCLCVHTDTHFYSHGSCICSLAQVVHMPTFYGFEHTRLEIWSIKPPRVEVTLPTPGACDLISQLISLTKLSPNYHIFLFG